MKSLGVVKDDFVINLVFCIPCATNFMDFQLGLEMGKKKYSDLKLHIDVGALKIWGPCSVAHVAPADRRGWWWPRDPDVAPTNLLMFFNMLPILAASLAR
jgi:hypothetical protein